MALSKRKQLGNVLLGSFLLANITFCGWLLFRMNPAIEPVSARTARFGGALSLTKPAAQPVPALATSGIQSTSANEYTLADPAQLAESIRLAQDNAQSTTDRVKAMHVASTEARRSQNPEKCTQIASLLLHIATQDDQVLALAAVRTLRDMGGPQLKFSFDALNVLKEIVNEAKFAAVKEEAHNLWDSVASDTLRQFLALRPAFHATAESMKNAPMPATRFERSDPSVGFGEAVFAEMELAIVWQEIQWERMANNNAWPMDIKKFPIFAQIPDLDPVLYFHPSPENPQLFLVVDRIVVQTDGSELITALFSDGSIRSFSKAEIMFEVDKLNALRKTSNLPVLTAADLGVIGKWIDLQK